MNKKHYIIKNCPNYYYDSSWEHPYRCNLTDGDWSCDVACTPDDDYGFNCQLKNVVDKCFLAKEGLLQISMRIFIDDLLKIFEIEECE